MQRRAVLDHQKWVSTMATDRNRHQNSKNCDGVSVPTQTGKEEEIASPSPSPCTSPRRRIPEEKA